MKPKGYLALSLIGAFVLSLVAIGDLSSTPSTPTVTIDQDAAVYSGDLLATEVFDRMQELGLEKPNEPILKGIEENLGRQAIEHDARSNQEIDRYVEVAVEEMARKIKLLKYVRHVSELGS